jgi:hypothetical protein
VAKKANPDLPVAPLPDLVRWWQSERTPAVVIGGLAVALLGRPRVTRDIDALVLLPEADWPAFLAAAAPFDLQPRDPDPLTFARQSRTLLLRHQPTGIDVDITFGNLPFEEEAVARAKKVRVGGVSVPLPTPEDLVILKAIAHRERDLLDVEGLLVAYPKLDTARVRQWVRKFADALDMPEIYEDLEKLLKRPPPQKRGKKQS